MTGCAKPHDLHVEDVLTLFTRCMCKAKEVRLLVVHDLRHFTKLHCLHSILVVLAAGNAKIWGLFVPQNCGSCQCFAIIMSCISWYAYEQLFCIKIQLHVSAAGCCTSKTKLLHTITSMLQTRPPAAVHLNCVSIQQSLNTSYYMSKLVC